MAKIVVTGATSFLGRHVVKQLIQEKYTVYAIVRPNSKNAQYIVQSDNCKIIYADIKNTEQWKAEIPGADIFFHFAWDGAGMQGRADAELQEENVRMSLACLRAASDLGVKRFIFSGSQAEYGPQDQPIDEATPCKPVTEYGKAKLCFYEEAVQLSRQLGMEYIHMRIFSVYGPGDHPWTLVNSCIDAFIHGENVQLSDCTQPWNFLYVDDFASAAVRLCNCSLSENEIIVNISGDETKPLKDYVNTIWTMAGKHGMPLYGAREKQLERPYGIMPKNDELHRLIEWSQKVDFAAGIQEMISIHNDSNL